VWCGAACVKLEHDGPMRRCDAPCSARMKTSQGGFHLQVDGECDVRSTTRGDNIQMQHTWPAAYSVHVANNIQYAWQITYSTHAEYNVSTAPDLICRCGARTRRSLWLPCSILLRPRHAAMPHRLFERASSRIPSPAPSRQPTHARSFYPPCMCCMWQRSRFPCAWAASRWCGRVHTSLSNVRPGHCPRAAVPLPASLVWGEQSFARQDAPTHTHTHTPTRTHARPHTHKRTHAHTHAHTHILTFTFTLTLTHSHTSGAGSRGASAPSRARRRTAATHSAD
jgi:hypothetical protein